MISLGVEMRTYLRPNHIGCQTAMAAADLSTHKNYMHGAAITKGRRILSLGCNQHKTHPIYSKRFKYSLCDRLHAEVYCILHAHTDLNGCKIFIARKTAAGFGLSRPCAMCMLLIQEAGIKEVIYTDDHNQWISEKV